jgi:peptidyl-prolyl cis-trans isomerase SurA
MKKYSFLFGLMLISITVFGQQRGSDFNHNAIVAEIDGEPITLGELISNYDRNNDIENISADELIEFLPSYVEYRMKLNEGLRLGYHDDPEILEEFNHYGREAAYTYWLEQDIKKEMIDTFRQRDEVELRAFHILAEIPENAEQAYRDSVYNRLLEARNLLQEGTDPEQINEEYSSRRNGNPMGGQLPWITAGRTVLDFENALYDLEPGEISNPIRTQFGFHVIYLQEKRDRTPDRRISHIFVRHDEGDEGKDEIYNAFRDLESGQSWNETVQNYTQDGATLPRGGQIGWVGYAMQFPEEFVDEVMAADPEAPFSQPIEMSYGYHIIRIDSVRTYTSEEQRSREIENRLLQLQRLDADREQVYDAVTQTGGMRVFDEHVDQILAGFSEDKPGDDLLSKPLLEFNEKTFKGSDFLAYLERENLVQNPSDFNNERFDEFKKEIIRSELIDITKEHFPDFKNEINHFLNGLIVFRVNDENMWSPETVNREELKDFFEANSENYIYDDEYVFYRISSLDQDLTEDALSNVLDGIHPADLHILFEDLSVLHDSTRNRYSSHYPYLEDLTPKETTELIERGSLFIFYYLEKINESRPMTFDEAFRRAASDFQPIREERYLNQLRNTYQVNLYPENIR